MSKPARSAVLLALLSAVLLPPSRLGAQGQSVEVRIEVPGMGQAVATGLHHFKLAIVDASGTTTYWSHDGTSSGGSEPRTWVDMYVDQGSVVITLGDTPSSNLPPLPPELLQAEDATLRVWASNAASGFRRLPDRKLRGKGFAYASEQARNSERLEGRRASDFETAGAVQRHEERYAHTPAGGVPGGRLYHASSDVGAARELDLHFDVPREDARLTLSLHASPPVGPPPLDSLKIQFARVDNQALGAPVDVVDYKGMGFLGGVRETWEFCNTCFKRKLPPLTTVLLDGKPFDAFQPLAKQIADDASVGRLDNLSPFGLVRFDRSLKVVSRPQGQEQATGQTAVWYYVVDRAAGGAPGAVQVTIDGADITSALVGLPEASASFHSSDGRMVAARFNGRPLPADGLDGTGLLLRRPDATWLTRGATVNVKPEGEGATLLVTGELSLAAGSRRFALEGKAPAALELLIDGQYQRAVALTSAGNADATLNLPESGWYQMRLVAGVPPGEATFSFRIDGQPARVRSVPLLGGEGGASWSAGPLDLGSAGIVLAPGAHVLTFRERSGRDGHLEYTLVVE